MSVNTTMFQFVLAIWRPRYTKCGLSSTHDYKFLTRRRDLPGVCGWNESRSIHDENRVRGHRVFPELVRASYRHNAWRVSRQVLANELLPVTGRAISVPISGLPLLALHLPSSRTQRPL